MRNNRTQRHRINRVIDHVRVANAAPLTLDCMAEIACLSRYHFSRVFASYCGETPVEFLTRTRLEHAITSLIYGQPQSITDIALEAGFSGSQAFSHSFRRRFGIGPKGFRDDNQGNVRNFPKNQIQNYPWLAEMPPVSDGERCAWPVSLHMHAEQRLAYVRYIGSYFRASGHHKSSIQLDAAFDRLIEWARGKGILDNKTCVYGLCPNNPRVTPPRYCQYDVCIPVDETVAEDEIVSIQILPQMMVAKLEMAGDVADVMRAWQWLVAEWIPNNGLTITNEMPFEIYHAHNSQILYPEDAVTLCIPVTKFNF